MSINLQCALALVLTNPGVFTDKVFIQRLRFHFSNRRTSSLLHVPALRHEWLAMDALHARRSLKFNAARNGACIQLVRLSVAAKLSTQISVQPESSTERAEHAPSFLPGTKSFLRIRPSQAASNFLLLSCSEGMCASSSPCSVPPWYRYRIQEQSSEAFGVKNETNYRQCQTV